MSTDDDTSREITALKAALSIVFGFGFWFAIAFWLWPSYGHHICDPAPRLSTFGKWIVGAWLGLRHALRMVASDLNEQRWKNLRHWIRLQTGSSLP